jgi:hypothetical protein
MNFGLLNPMSGMNAQMGAAQSIASPMMGALSRRRRQINYVTDDSLPPQSAVQGLKMQDIIRQRRQQQYPGMMQGMGGALGGKI